MNTLLHNYQIQTLLPHRYPFQLVDQVVEFDLGKSILGIKSIGIGEPSLQGHFPGFPIFPGVLLVEALGQVCGLLLELTSQKWDKMSPPTIPLDENNLGVLGGMKMKMVNPVLPGTQVFLKAELDWTMGSASSLNVVAFNGDTVFAKGSIVVASISKEKLLPDHVADLA